jgi:C-terminal processing protease CtpA/Prc
MQDLRIGAAGQPTTLTLQTLQGEGYTVTLTRQPTDDYPLRGPGLREARLPRCTELQPGYLYVDLDRFHDDDFSRDVLPKLAKAKGVVFDVRGYPTVNPGFLGQLTDRPLSSEMYQTVVTLWPDHHDMKLEGRPWTIPPSRFRLPVKAAFLTDGRAVSYAETFMALVARHKLGPIIGSPTAGTNGGVNIYVLPDGSRISWTAQKARKLDGSRHHGIGVLPDVAVRRTVNGIGQGRDEVVEKALQLIR